MKPKEHKTVTAAPHSVMTMPNMNPATDIPFFNGITSVNIITQIIWYGKC